MLVLSRKKNESIVIRTSDGEITLHVSQIEEGQVKLAFEAPRCVEIWRSELKVSG